MESAIPRIPLPSVGWSHLAASQGEMARPEAALPMMMPAPQSAKEETSQLRARLLRMIVDREHSRKAASAEAFNVR